MCMEHLKITGSIRKMGVTTTVYKHCVGTECEKAYEKMSNKRCGLGCAGCILCLLVFVLLIFSNRF